jgi:transcriptional regulator of stress and heat shock response
MANLSEQIELYLRDLMEEYGDIIKINRNQLADNFDCVPSQINYVLDTRFTVEKGYIVESQRGGGGYIKIIRLKIDSEKEILKNLILRMNNHISQRKAGGIIERLFDNNIITERERYLMEIAMHRDVLSLELPQRDFIRERILRGMLEVILKFDNEEA